MKKHLILMLVLAATLLMTSCTKSKGDYYVRYEVTLTSFFSGTMTVDVNTEKGVQSFQTSSNTFSETFGPVNKGFKASVQTSYSHYAGTLNSSIYVCKADEPFILKATGSSSVEYVIGF